MSPISLPRMAVDHIYTQATGLLKRDDSGNTRITGLGIAGIVLLVLAVVFTTTLVAICLVRRRRNAASRDSFVPNNFKVVSTFSSILDSRRASRPISVYKPTNEYGQYRAPPLPQQAHHHARSVSHANILRNGSV